MYVCMYIYRYIYIDSNPQNERTDGHLQKHGRNIIYNSLGEDKRQNIRKLPLLNVAMENHNFW